MSCDVMDVPLCRNLPAKPPAEVRKHQKMYEQMVAAARKKGQQRHIISQTELLFGHIWVWFKYRAQMRLWNSNSACETIVTSVSLLKCSIIHKQMSHSMSYMYAAV